MKASSLLLLVLLELLSACTPRSAKVQPIPENRRRMQARGDYSIDTTGSGSLFELTPIADASISDPGDTPSGPSPEPPGTKKSYVIPALEILGFQLALNLFNRTAGEDSEEYASDLHSIKNNLEHGWVFDRDSFNINQIGHPYQGSIYYGLARTSGLDFWESFGYTTAASFIWEIAGETTDPSVNDQITTSVGGTFLGEAFYRTAETFIERRNSDDTPVPEVTAAVVSPPAEINRLAMGEDVKKNLPRRKPAVFSTFQLGGLRNTHVANTADVKEPEENEVGGSFHIAYGLPGEPGYEYNRPMDYFNFDLALRSGDNGPVEELDVRGLIFGKKYDSTDAFRGVYGLYGGYDYLAPQTFRVASTSLSLGSTGQLQMGNSVALQGTVLGGCGFGAAGTVVSSADGKDYHYGAIPQALVALRLILGNFAYLDFAGREFYVTGPSSDDSGTSNENVARAQISLTTRVFGPHALSLQYAASRRDADLSSIEDQHQRVETIGAFYTYLWGDDLGNVQWHNDTHR